MKASIPAIRKYGRWGIVVVLVVWLINATRDQIIWNALVSVFSILQNISELIIRFSIDHLGVAVIVFSCLWVIGLITHAYFDTLPPHGIDVSKEVIKDVLGTSVHTGFLITNNSGEDLQDCKIYISQIDDEKQYRNSERDYLSWGARSFNGQVNSIDIPNTESGSVFMRQIGYKMKSRKGNDKFEGNHDLEMIFNANSMSGKKITLYVYCTIMVGVIEETENSEERAEITLLKSET